MQMKKIVLASATLLTVGATVIAPTAAHAQSQKTQLPNLSRLTQTKKLITLNSESNGAVSVTTELNCTDHTLVANVSNKTDSKITPTVTFNGQRPTFPSDASMPIEPGETGKYFWSFSGNNLLAKVVTEVDTYDPLTVAPTLTCSEPISFQITAASKSAVTGTLTNNSSFVGQTVYTRVNSGDIHIEHLDPGESRLIALSFNSTLPEPQTAFVSLGTDDGYEGTYSVPLNQPKFPL